MEPATRVAVGRDGPAIFSRRCWCWAGSPPIALVDFKACRAPLSGNKASNCRHPPSHPSRRSIHRVDGALQQQMWFQCLQFAPSSPSPSAHTHTQTRTRTVPAPFVASAAPQHQSACCSSTLKAFLSSLLPLYLLLYRLRNLFDHSCLFGMSE